MNLNFVSRTARGLVRADNQDNVLCIGKMGLFAVADGMGGGSSGGLASKIVCDELSLVSSADFKARIAEIDQAVATANSRILAHAREHGFRQMGSTVALLAVDESGCKRGVIGYAGDSRVYRVRGGAAELLTRDHSIGAELEDTVGTAGGKFSARSNPLAHILTRAIGTKECVLLEWRKIDIAAGDRFVICSDGVHDTTDTDTLARLVAGKELEQAADALVRGIVAQGAPDNYSFVIVETEGAQ
jgi:serine/threonine protein phosphatase PrpC